MSCRRIEAADGREIADAIAVDQAMTIFLERDIHRPVQRVLDAPVCADDAREMFRLWVQAAQVEARFIGLDPVAFDALEDDGQGSQARPGLAMRRVFWQLDDADLTLFDTAMRVLGRQVQVRRQP